MGLRGWQLSALSTNKGFSLLHSKVSIFKTVQPPETTRVSGTHSLLCNWWGTCWLTLLGDTVRTLLLFLMFPRVAPLTVQPRQLHMHTWKHTNRQIRFLLLFKIKSQWKPQKKKEKYISAEFMKVPFSVVFFCLSEREEKSKAVSSALLCFTVAVFQQTEDADSQQVFLVCSRGGHFVLTAAALSFPDVQHRYFLSFSTV